MNRLVKRIKACALYFFAIASWPVFSQDPQSLVNSINYGIPVSPAFELLPSKPSETSNLVTPKDVYTTIPSFISDGKLKTGVAADIRPFSYWVGNLAAYQNNKLKQILWRTVVAVGTAPAVTGDDAYLSTGLRTTIIDKGDPRANRAYIDRLVTAYANGLGSLPTPPSFNMTQDQLNQRAIQAAQASELGMLNADTERENILKDSWNAFKVDVGAAYMVKAVNGSFQSDQLKADRWGIWVASGIPIGKKGQLSITGKTSKVLSATSNQSETSRHVAGGRLRVFICKSFAVSGEIAGLWSNYSQDATLNEAWTHFAIISEIKVPLLGGWVNLAYGGDTAHRTSANSKFSFSYAISANRILKQ
ncbi:hypothetical protein [Spirosoma foliorum]|uniref:Uncharacterized protein n=1 Tax=Spirosoma foliorum TaxID=2710596 RepID=A0A7G5GRL1_9BACT|nr:hypothetical protein [Spirosoma foliorum]QMW01503.1 hypothetical protein H3H32_26605 [Spirosoma foliorum]